jgi:hypothetical protein
VSETLKGFSFPFRFDGPGRVAVASGDAKLRENVVHILMTGPGERIMRRDYGAGLRQLLHDPNNDALRAIMQHQVAKAIARFEPRVLLQDVTVGQDEDDARQGVLRVSVTFTVRRTRQTQQISVPIGLGGI